MIRNLYYVTLVHLSVRRDIIGDLEWDFLYLKLTQVYKFKINDTSQ